MPFEPNVVHRVPDKMGLCPRRKTCQGFDGMDGSNGNDTERFCGREDDSQKM
jgi:hypothetical protein